MVVKRRQNQGEASEPKEYNLVGKRAVARAIRAFFLWGRATFRQHNIRTFQDLTQHFPIKQIAQVRGQIATKRQYWAAHFSGTTTDTQALEA